MASNIADVFAERVGYDPERPALVHQQQSWTFAEMLSRADVIAEKLRGLVSGPSPRIALFCPNGPDYVALALGILRAGGCLVPVASELAPPEREVQLALTAPQILIAAGPLQWLPKEGTAETYGGVSYSWCALEYRASFSEERFAALNPAFIRFSSGTTGESKGVVLSHESLLARVQSANRRLQINPEDRVLWTLPMAHHFAVSIMLYLTEGATTVLEDSHLAAEVLTTARSSGATVFYGSPFHLALLAAEDSGRDWTTLRLAVGTAAALPKATSGAFQARYGRAPMQGFGIIEAGLPLLNDDAGKPDSVGRPGDFTIRICDEQGGDVSEGEIGELIIKGPGLFDAYLSPWQEREDIAPGGWFSTGDLACVDAEGYVFLKGRRKSVINFGGMKFFPEEVEAAINTHPAVRESRVLGEPHERWGAVAVAEFIPQDATMPPTGASLSKHCRERLAGYKVPVKFRVVSEIPRTASGKIKRG